MICPTHEIDGLAAASPKPLRRFSAGTTRSCAVTRADTGLPGSAKSQRFSLPFSSLSKDPASSVAKVVGFPGFMWSRPKRTVPRSADSRTALAWSARPTDAPPVDEVNRPKWAPDAGAPAPRAYAKGNDPNPKQPAGVPKFEWEYPGPKPGTKPPKTDAGFY